MTTYINHGNIPLHEAICLMYPWLSGVQARHIEREAEYQRARFVNEMAKAMKPATTEED